jgi:hypothetical protein
LVLKPDVSGFKAKTGLWGKTVIVK